VYLNRHYASDALAGLAIGMACAWLAPRIGRRRASPGPESPQPLPRH